MQRIGRYEVIRPLGRGGMGQVFLARDPTLERDVALKLLVHETDPTARTLMQAEAKALAALSHPNIVTIFEIGDDGGQQFIAMEYLPGQSLRDVLQKDQPSRDSVLAICAQVATAVDAAHAANILHRDIKPENVVVGKTGVKVVDFGIARRMDRASMPQISQPVRARATSIVDAFMRTLTPEPGNSTIATAITSSTQTMFGTPAYMAPEVLGGEVSSKASDVYSLGVMLHECLVGRRPHDAPNLAEMIAHAIDDTEPVPRIDDPLGEMIEQMLDRDPAKRPALVTIAKALGRTRSLIGTPPRRVRWIVPAIAGCALAVVGVVAVTRGRGQVAQIDAATDRGKLSIRDFTISIPSYGAQDGDAHALSQVIAMEVQSTTVDAADPDTLRKKVTDETSADQWERAARAAGATLLATGSITETNGRLVAEVAILDLDTRATRNTQISTDTVDVPELVDRVAEWLAREVRPSAVLGREPSSTRSNKFIELSTQYANQRQWTAARAYIEQAVHTDRSSGEAWDRFAEVLEMVQAPREITTSAFEHAVERVPDGPRRHILHGALLVHQYDFRRAIAELAPLETTKLTATDQRDLLYQLGEAHWHEGHQDVGYGYFKRVLELDPAFIQAAQHAGEYALARRDIESARMYVATQHTSQDWSEFAAGHYEKLAVDGNATFKLWAQTVLERPLTPAPGPPDPATVAMNAIVDATTIGDQPAAKRALDDLLAFYENRPYTGGTTIAMNMAGEAIVIAGFAEETRRILGVLRTHAPNYSYKRLSILASPMLGNPGFAADELTDRLKKLSEAITAEIAGNRKRAAELLTELVRDPTFEWDYPERVALVRNLRALGKKAEAAAICADTLKPAVMRHAFAAARAYCRRR